MKKLFTLAAAVLASLTMWAATETVPKFSDNWTGTSINFSHNEGANGSSDQKKDGDTEKVTYVKFRTNKNGNTITLNVNEGYQVTGLSVRGYTNDGSTGVSLVSVKYDNQDAVETNIDFPLSGAGTTATYQNNTDVARSAIVLQMSNSGKQLMAVMTVTYSLACTSPETPLSLSSDAAETVYVGDVITFSTAGGNGGEITIEGANSETITDGKWTATAGEHTFTASQAKNGDYCAQESEAVVLTVYKKAEVETCTIAGPTAGYAGYTLTYTAEAENATTYEWYVDGVAANNNSATFNYTAVKGNHAIKATATNEFTATPVESNTINVAVTSLYGELIAVTRNGASLNEVTGIIGGTAAKNTQDNGKLGSDGHYWRLTLASGNFMAGDTVIITTSAEAQQGTLKITSDQAGTDELGDGGIGVVGANKIVLTKGGVNTIWMVRINATNKWNGVIDAMAVVRPMPVKSTVETLTAVSVNEVAISAADLATLQADHAVALTASYPAAPKVAFTKHIVITYEDDSQKESDAVIEVTAEENADGKWEAKATINAIEYVVTAEQEASATITYMDGENKLGEEVVAVGAHPAEFAQYQSKQLSSFVAWYSDAALENAVTIEEAVITQDTTFYAKFENAYATSVNFEKIVMQNSKGYAIIEQLGTQHYASNITGSLDSLDNSKSDKLRNYAYLGLKVKQSGALLNFRLAAGKTVKIKFGDIKTANPHLSVNEGAYAEMTITDKVFSYTAEADALLSIKTVNGDAVVFQQIAIGEELAAPELFSITCETVDNGTFATPYKLGIPNENVVITATPADGYKTALVLVNETRLTLGEEISFDMPAENVTITGEFTVSGFPTALDNTEDNAKAIKTIENGQIVIIKNGVRYNVLGAELR